MSKGIFVGTLLALLFLSRGAFSQTVESVPERENEAVLVDSFGRISNGDLRGRLDTFLAEVAIRDPESRGVVVNYGTVREVEARKRWVVNHMAFRGFDATRISLRLGGNVSQLRTDFWKVPAGAAQPKLEPEAFVISEIGKATKSQLEATIKRLFRTIADNPSHHNYIVNYGSDAEIASREKVFLRAIIFRNFDRARVTLVRGGRKAGPRTVFWSIPPGAANPVP